MRTLPYASDARRPPSSSLPNAAGETIPSTQRDASAPEPVTGESPVGSGATLSPWVPVIGALAAIPLHVLILIGG